MELKFQGIECLGVELSDAQRVFALAQLEASVTTKEIAATLGCSSRCIQKTVTRWKETSSTTSRRRMGRPPVLNSRDHRRLHRLARRYPKLEYRKLMEEAGLWDAESTHPQVSQRTVQRTLAKESLHKFRAKRRPKITPKTAEQRLEMADTWCGWDWRRGVFRFSDECSIARGSGHNSTWV